MSNNNNMKGLILSGGKGTRLRPITFSMAKQLVPVANKPVLFYGLESFKEAGITEVGIIVGDTQDAIVSAVGDGSHWGLNVTYIPQDKPAGLAHAVKIAEPFLQKDPFVMYLGDNIVRSGIKDLAEEFNKTKPDAMILLAQVPNPSEFGVAELAGDKVVRLEEKPKEPKSDFALVGVYLFTSCIFNAVNSIKPSWRNELEITDAIQFLISSGKQVQSKIVEGWWKDTGDLDAILDANRLVLEDIKAEIRVPTEGSKIEGRVDIGKNTIIINSTVRGPAIIGENCHLENCFIGPFSAIGANTVMKNSEIDYSIVLPDCKIENVEHRIEKSLLGGGVQVLGSDERPKSLRLMLGDNSTVRLP